MAENLQDYLKKYGITSPAPSVGYDKPKADLSSYLQSYGINPNIKVDKYSDDLTYTIRQMDEKKRQLDYAIANPVKVDTSVPAYKPVVAKASPLQTVGYTFLSGLANLVRTTFTPAKDKAVTGNDTNNVAFNFLKNTPYVKNLNKNPIQADSITGKLAKATVEKVIPSTEAYRNKSGDYLKGKEKEFANKADLQNQKASVRIIANALASTPVSIATRIPIVGWYLMGNQSYRNALENTQSRINNGELISGNAAMLNAIGSAGIEIGSEMMFGLFRKVGGTKTVGSLIDATRGYLDGVLGKGITQIGKSSMGAFVRSVAKTPVSQIGFQILQQGAEEGSEEVVGGIGSGILAKLTTDKAADLFSFNDKNSLITFMGLSEAFLTGAVSGGGITAVRSTPAFFNRNNYISTINKTVEQMSNQDATDYVDAVKADMQDEKNQEFVADANAEFIDKNTSQEVKDLVDELVNNKLKEQEPSGIPFNKYSGTPVSGVRYNTAPLVEPQAQSVAPEPIQNVVQAPTASSVAENVKVPVKKAKGVKVAVEGDVVTTGKLKKGTYNKIVREDGKQVTKAVDGYVYKGVGINSDNLITHTQSGVMIYNGKELSKTNAKKLAVWIAENLNAETDTKSVVTQMREADASGMTFNDKMNAYIKSISVISKSKANKSTKAQDVKQEVNKVGEKTNKDIVRDYHIKRLKEALSDDINKTDPEVLKYGVTEIAIEIGWIQDGGESKYKIEPLKIRMARMEKVIHDYMTKKYPPDVSDSSDAFDLIDNNPVKQEVKPVEKKKEVMPKVTNLEITNKFNSMGLRFVNGIVNGQQMNVPMSKNVTKESAKLRLIDAWEKLYNKQSTPQSEVDKKTKTYEIPYAGDVISTNREFAQTYGEHKKTAQEINAEVVSEIVKESQVQDDSALNYIIPKSAQRHFNSVKSNPVTSYRDTISDEAKARMKASTDFDKNEPVKDRLSKLRKWIQKNVSYGSIPIDPKYGDVRVGFRELRMSDRIASQEAEKLISLSYNKAGKEKHQLMSDAILYFDLMEDINNGRYNRDSSMMFGINSAEDVIKTAQAIAVELKKPENEIVIKAMETRRRLMDEVRTRLVNEGKKAGIDLSIVFAKKDYMFHAITEYQSELNAAKKAQSKNGKIKYKERTGSDKDFIADPIVSDFIVLRSMERNISRVKLYNAIKVHDISSESGLMADNSTDIKDGYAELDPSILGVVTYDADSKTKMVSMAVKTLKANNIDRSSKEGLKILKAAEREAQKTMLIVPEEIAQAVLKEFERPEHGVAKGMKKIMNVWKYSKLRLPNVVIKYNMRNLYGDLDAVFIGRPEALAKVPKAIKELYGFYYKKGVMTAQLKDFIDRTGLSTGQTIQELKALKGSKLFEFYEDAITTQDMSKKAIAKVWQKLTLETETEFREQILRYAAYLSYTSELSKRSNGLPKYYAASIPREIQSITDVKTRAAKLSNDLLGAYDDTSIAGQYAADHLIPFYRFMEVNVKRYFRLTKNIFYNDPATLKIIGEKSASRIGMAGRVGASMTLRMAKVTLGVTLFYGLMDMFNNIFAPDEEDKLTEEAKRSPHLTVPSWFFGGDNGRTYYFDRLGSFSDLLNMLGIDRGIGNDMSDILSGKMSMSDKLKQMAMSPVYNTYNSASPLFKMTTELLTGKSFYPNPSSPTQIRDKWEYVFKQLGLADEYKLLAGKPMPNGSFAEQKRNILFNSVQSGDSAYWDLMGIKDQFLKVKGIGKRYTAYDDTNSVDYKRANAMYYYKQAIKMNDNKAALKYLEEYARYGGNEKKKKASMNAMDPLFGMSNENKKMFIEWLDTEDRATYDKAMGYFSDISSMG